MRKRKEKKRKNKHKDKKEKRKSRGEEKERDGLGPNRLETIPLLPVILNCLAVNYYPGKNKIKNPEDLNSIFPNKT
jgi:hypothetical protein